MKLAKFDIDSYLVCRNNSTEILKHEDGTTDKFASDSLFAFVKSITAVLEEFGFSVLECYTNSEVASNGILCINSYYRPDVEGLEDIKCTLMVRVLKHPTINVDSDVWSLKSLSINGYECFSYLVALDYIKKLISNW